MVVDFFINNWLVISFYVGVIALIFFNRDKFEFEGKVIALYKTTLGIDWMKKISRKYPTTVKWFGTIGIWAGYIGMIGVVSMIGYGLWQLIYRPEAPPMFTPVLPGFTIPGGIHLPLVEGLIALFIVIVIHEFSHGVVSKVYDIPINSSGFVMFGPIPGAFVEPDEDKLEESSSHTQLSIYSAGPFSNFLLFFVLFAAGLVISPLIVDAYAPSGLVVEGYTNESLERLDVGDKIISFEGKNITDHNSLQEALSNTSPGDDVTIGLEDEDVSMEVNSHPENNQSPFLGITLSQEVSPSNENSFLSFLQQPIFWLFGNPYGLSLSEALGVLQWTFVLSFGIGLVNLLPLGPVDGGKMFLLGMQRFFTEDTAMKIWYYVSWVFFITLIILVFVPIIRSLFA